MHLFCLLFHSLNSFNSWCWTRLKSGISSTIGDSQAGGSRKSDSNWRWDLIPGTRTWGAGIPSSCLICTPQCPPTTRPTIITNKMLRTMQRLGKGRYSQWINNLTNNFTGWEPLGMKMKQNNGTEHVWDAPLLYQEVKPVSQGFSQEKALFISIVYWGFSPRGTPSTFKGECSKTTTWK